jgi:hypothetical protein
MIQLIEADVSFHSFSESEGNDNLALVRVDLKRKDHIRVFSFLPIVRFLHASERCDYSLYPLYPIDRANVESTIVLMLQAFSASGESNTKFLNVLQRCLEKKEYLLYDQQVDRGAITKLSDPTMADLVGYYLLECVQAQLPKPIQEWKQRMENHY